MAYDINTLNRIVARSKRRKRIDAGPLTGKPGRIDSGPLRSPAGNLSSDVEKVTVNERPGRFGAAPPRKTPAKAFVDRTTETLHQYQQRKFNEANPQLASFRQAYRESKAKQRRESPRRPALKR